MVVGGSTSSLTLLQVKTSIIAGDFVRNSTQAGIERLEVAFMHYY